MTGYEIAFQHTIEAGKLKLKNIFFTAYFPLYCLLIDHLLNIALWLAEFGRKRLAAYFVT